MSPRKSHGRHKSSKATTFEVFLRLRESGMFEPDQVNEFKSFLSDAYSRTGWTEEHVEHDFSIFIQECITSKAILKDVILAGYQYHVVAIPLVVLDILAQSLFVPIKLKFHSATEQHKDKLKDLIVNQFPEAFVKERIHTPELLLSLSKKTWKKLRLPAGIKVQVERVFDTLKELEEGIGKIDLLTADDNRIKVIAAGGKVYETDRYCPHKKVDLQGAPIEGTILTCPKHKWKFDLAQGGRCIEGKFFCSLNAQPLEW